MAYRMEMDGCSACIKYILGFINLFLFIGGVAIMILGILSLTNDADFGDLIDLQMYKVGSILVTTAGAFVAVVTFLGCCGAFKENKCLLYTYFCLVLILFVLLVAGGIVGYVFYGKIEDVVRDGLEETMDEFDANKDMRDAWDTTQKDLKCCGVDGPKDWGKHNVTPLPSSCCKDGKPGCTTTSKNTFEDGCVDKIEDIVKSASHLVAGVAIGVAVVLFMSMMAACVIIRAISVE